MSEITPKRKPGNPNWVKKEKKEEQLELPLEATTPKPSVESSESNTWSYFYGSILGTYQNVCSDSIIKQAAVAADNAMSEYKARFK